MFNLSHTKRLLVIISSSLTVSEESRLLSVLRKNREALGWQLIDIKRIEATICTNRILSNEDSKPIKQPQRILNPLKIILLNILSINTLAKLVFED